MAHRIIEFPISPRMGFLQVVYSALVGMAAYSASPVLALPAVLALNITMLSRPKTASLDGEARTLVFNYRWPYALWRSRVVDLSKYVLVYSQAESYVGRSLHLSGLGGEHMRLAHFHQHARFPDLHVEEVAALRAEIAGVLGIRDGGEL